MLLAINPKFVLSTLNQNNPGGLLNPQALPAEAFGLGAYTPQGRYDQTSQHNNEEGDPK
jgi:hypothetical protein